MSPFRRRKSRMSRARARRQQLVQRERQAYGRERTEQDFDEPSEVIEPTQEVTRAPEVEEVVEAAEVEAPELDAPETEAPRKAREFQPQRRSAPPPGRKTARRRRQRRRRRVRRPSFGGLRSASTSGARGLRSASSSGARATVQQAGPGTRRLLGGLGRGLAWLLSWPLRLAALLARLVIAVFGAVRATAARSLQLAERYVTPERVLVAVTGAAAACLAYSQFVDYRGVEVGLPQYSSVSTIAPPPQESKVLAGQAHAYVLVPLAAIALAIAVVALVSGRWRLGRLVSIVGLVGIAISFAIDLPKGLDAGTAGLAYAGAKATLTKGFYAQVAASAVLVLCGWALSLNLRQHAGGTERRKRRARFRRPRTRRAPSVARGGA